MFLLLILVHAAFKYHMTLNIYWSYKCLSSQESIGYWDISFTLKKNTTGIMIVLNQHGKFQDALILYMTERYKFSTIKLIDGYIDEETGSFEEDPFSSDYFLIKIHFFDDGDAQVILRRLPDTLDYFDSIILPNIANKLSIFKIYAQKEAGSDIIYFDEFVSNYETPVYREECSCSHNIPSIKINYIEAQLELFFFLISGVILFVCFVLIFLILYKKMYQEKGRYVFVPISTKSNKRYSSIPNGLD